MKKPTMPSVKKPSLPRKPSRPSQYKTLQSMYIYHASKLGLKGKTPVVFDEGDVRIQLTQTRLSVMVKDPEYAQKRKQYEERMEDYKARVKDQEPLLKEYNKAMKKYELDLARYEADKAEQKLLKAKKDYYG